MTLLSSALKGIITPEMEQVAAQEGVTTEFVRQGTAEGTIVIPRNVQRRNVVPVGIGAGFCRNVFMWQELTFSQGSRWRGRSPENIVEEMDRIISKRGTREFYFTDPNFFGPRQRGQERALRLAYLLKARNIRFTLMGGIWSGKVEEPGGATVKYDKMNRLLVERFEAILKALEAGERFPAERKEALVDEARKELETILRDWSESCMQVILSPPSEGL